MNVPANITMIEAATAETISNVFVNNNCAAVTLQITGSFTTATVQVEGLVNLNSNSWVSLGAIELGDFELNSDGLSEKSLYQIGIEGIPRVRIHVTAVSGGDITVVCQFGNAVIDPSADATPANLTPITAYDMAVDGGYTGTKAQFETDMGNSATNATNAAASASAAAASAQSVSASAAQIATNNSDISELKTQLNNNKTATPGYMMRATNDGLGTEWAPVGTPTDAQAEAAINAWLEEHPEATTTVEDHSLTYKKLVNGTLGFVTPQMYGAKGDGITDDTTAFQSAINNNDVVYIPKGEYNISTSLTLHEHIVVIGAGRDSAIINCSGTGFCFKLGNLTQDSQSYKSHENISGLTIHCANGNKAISMFQCAHCSINNLTIDGISADALRGIELLGCVDTQLNNIDIKGDNSMSEPASGQQPCLVYIGNGYDNMTGTTIKLNNCYIHYGFHGLHHNAGLDCTLNDCIIESNYQNGINVINGNVYVNNSYFENNKRVLYNGFNTAILTNCIINDGVNLNDTYFIYPGVNNGKTIVKGCSFKRKSENPVQTSIAQNIQTVNFIVENTTFTNPPSALGGKSNKSYIESEQKINYLFIKKELQFSVSSQSAKINDIFETKIIDKKTRLLGMEIQTSENISGASIFVTPYKNGSALGNEMRKEIAANNNHGFIWYDYFKSTFEVGDTLGVKIYTDTGFSQTIDVMVTLCCAFVEGA